MKKLNAIKLICKILIVTMGLESAAFAQSDVIQGLKDEMTKNPYTFVDDDENTSDDVMTNKAMALADLENTISLLKDETQPLELIKEDLVKQALEEEEIQVLELNRLLIRMSTEQLDRVFETAQKSGNYSSDLFLDYLSAYKADEKRAVMLNLAREDIFRIKTATLKRLGIMDRAALIRELEATKSVLNVKGKDTWLVIAAIILTVAAAGFLGWAIVKGVKNRFIRKSHEMDEEYQHKFDEAYADYLKDEQDVINFWKEREELREQGYVWTICSTTQSNKTMTCSYDHRAYSGSEVCVTRCLKNPSTGTETHKMTSCTSAYIPSNCMVMNPYEKGYNDGYNQGYPDGYHDGYQDKYWKGYYDYYSKGYDAGYVRGYDYGYNDGFADGYAQAEYDATHRAGKNAGGGDSVQKGYTTGYQQGYAQAMALLVH